MVKATVDSICLEILADFRRKFGKLGYTSQDFAKMRSSIFALGKTDLPLTRPRTAKTPHSLQFRISSIVTRWYIYRSFTNGVYSVESCLSALFALQICVKLGTRVNALGSSVREG